MSQSSIPKISISALGQYNDSEISLNGWVQNKRENKGLAFIILRDGTGFCQCVANESQLGENFAEASKLTQESSVIITGRVVEDTRQIGGYELHITHVEPLQIVQDYPITNKEHGVEFLLDRRHLWLRSKRQWAIMRIRNQVIYSIHNFFQARDFVQMDAPIFTGNACEGTTNLFETDFYDQPAYLSQSGQLYGEAMAMAMGKIYTFGPTFRAEKSKTRRHLSEFWMIEPEMAFYTLEMTMDVIEDFLKAVVSGVLEKCDAELDILGRDKEKLKASLEPFARITYKEAVDILKGRKELNGKTSIDLLNEDLATNQARLKELNSDIEEKEELLAKGGMKKGKVGQIIKAKQVLVEEKKVVEEALRNIPDWLNSAKNFTDGDDLGGSDETVITRMFETPVMVYNWPKAVKAFYMKESDEDPGLAKGVDVLAPEGYGEIVGGGERETDINKLIASIEKHELPMNEFEWYLDLRRYGSVPHAGFGLGLERLITWVCKIHHLRETIPFPRLMGRLLP